MLSITRTQPQVDYAQWRDSLKALFPVAEEFGIAAAIYWFEADYHNNGLSPQQSYDAFDAWTRNDDFEI